jgi:hypothetical protein
LIIEMNVTSITRKGRKARNAGALWLDRELSLGQADRLRAGAIINNPWGSTGVRQLGAPVRVKRLHSIHSTAL